MLFIERHKERHKETQREIESVKQRETKRDGSQSHFTEGSALLSADDF
jgi:uncharacterized membrane-anchored protein YhcB (DUF1043 family)